MFFQTEQSPTLNYWRHPASSFGCLHHNLKGWSMIGQTDFSKDIADPQPSVRLMDAMLASQLTHVGDYFDAAQLSCLLVFHREMRPIKIPQPLVRIFLLKKSQINANTQPGTMKQLSLNVDIIDKFFNMNRGYLWFCRCSALWVDHVVKGGWTFLPTVQVLRICTKRWTTRQSIAQKQKV